MRNRRKAFTIIELLIAVIIIGILVAIIIPVYVKRSDEARLTAAQADVEALSTAEQHVGIDTGYFFPFYVLDDVSSLGDNLPSGDPNDRIDSIFDEEFRTDVGFPTRIFIDSRSGDVLTNGDAIYQRMVQDLDVFGWKGPYMNIQKKTAQQAAPTQPHPAGLPLDPWGSPYLLFTRMGVLDYDLMETNHQYTAADGTNYTTPDTQPWFDRPTVLSMGPNGLPGNGITAPPNEQNFGQGDDIYRQF